MSLISPALDPLLFASLALATPFVSYAGSRLVDRCKYWWKERPKTYQRPEGTMRTVLGAVLALHTLYTFYVLVFAKPPNLFTALGVPISIKQSQLRKTIAAHADAPPFPITPSFEVLLSRLASFDVRVLFLRFGQDTLQTCAHCHTHSDFQQYALPRSLLEYLREAAVVGVLTQPFADLVSLSPDDSISNGP
ncbi:hypothetical protein EWM64_g9646 [Hericium alpestre]|uniref:Uncharacterized protein n=1 Tax=Hericium alpestre TaxID=135208 RepID=A0A4Y9ZI07_9AGAM|nr:hypothetical protein EWM64_g9646 [Hericium alpestre]